MNTRGQRSLRAIFESWLPQWGKSEYEGLLFLILFYSTTGVPDVGVEELPLWCIYITEFSHPLTLLCPGALALGHADRWTKSLLFLDRDRRVNSQWRHWDAAWERGSCVQLWALEDVREVRQTRERGTTSAAMRSLKKDHSENYQKRHRNATEGVRARRLCNQNIF